MKPEEETWRIALICMYMSYNHVHHGFVTEWKWTFADPAHSVTQPANARCRKAPRSHFQFEWTAQRVHLNLLKSGRTSCNYIFVFASINLMHAISHKESYLLKKLGNKSFDLHCSSAVRSFFGLGSFSGKCRGCEFTGLWQEITGTLALKTYWGINYCVFQVLPFKLNMSIRNLNVRGALIHQFLIGLAPI